MPSRLDPRSIHKGWAIETRYEDIDGSKWNGLIGRY
jgi:hypothetical protein